MNGDDQDQSGQPQGDSQDGGVGGGAPAPTPGADEPTTPADDSSGGGEPVGGDLPPSEPAVESETPDSGSNS